jgi:uncharacterized membrane protein YccC
VWEEIDKAWGLIIAVIAGLSAVVTAIRARRKTEAETGGIVADNWREFAEALERLVNEQRGELRQLQAEFDAERRLRRENEAKLADALAQLSDEQRRSKELASQIQDLSGVVSGLRQENERYKSQIGRTRDWAERLVKQIVGLGGKPEQLDEEPPYRPAGKETK